MSDKNEKVPEVVKEEPNDKPAGFAIPWTIVISIVLLIILYFMIFNE